MIILEIPFHRIWFFLRLQSVPCNVILCVLDKEPVAQKRCVSQCTAKRKYARSSEGLTNTTKLWGPRCLDATGCVRQSSRAKEGNQAIPNSWPG